MNDTAVFFAHHRSDERSLRNLRLLVEASEGCDVVPIGFDSEQTMPAAARISHRSRFINRCLPAKEPGCPPAHSFSCDALLYEWFYNRPRDYARYVWLEWDTLARQPIREFFTPVWQLDYSASHLVRHGDDTWYNWRYASEEAWAAAGPLMLGQWPTCGVVLSHRCLLAITSLLRDLPAFDELFCEMRMPTLARLAGFMPCENLSAQRTIHWHPSKVCADAIGVIHPIKD